MKEIMDSIPAQPAGDEENFANRKLIRPALPRPDHNHGNHNSNHPPVVMERRDRNDRHERHDRPERGFERVDRGDRGMGPGGARKTALTNRAGCGPSNCPTDKIIRKNNNLTSASAPRRRIGQ